MGRGEDDSEDDNTSTSSVNTVFNRLKDKSTPELEEYYETKQQELDETRNTHIADNRAVNSDSEAGQTTVIQRRNAFRFHTAYSVRFP